MQEQTDAIEIDLRKVFYHFLKSAKRFWWIPLLCTLLLAIALPTVQKLTTVPDYKATCSFTVQVVNTSVTESLHSQYSIYYDKDLAEQLSKTFTYILTSDHLGDQVRQELNRELGAGRISAKCITGSNLFEITALGSSPEEAYNLLTTVMEVFPQAARYVVGDLAVEILEEPRAGTAPYNQVNTKRSALLGGLGGFVLACLILALIAMSIQTVQKPEELEGALNMRCLGVVPMTRERTGNLTDGIFRESIRGICRKVETAMERDKVKCLLVAGTAPNEGKSLISRHLAQTLAEWGNHVCLVDCDLRKPSLHKLLKCGGRQLPMVDYLQGKVTLDTLFCDTPFSGLTLVGNSQVSKDPAALLTAPAMQTMLAELTSRFDYVILDTPPCRDFADVAALQNYADRILYVVRQNETPRQQILDAVERLTDDQSKLLGFVLNFVEKTAGGYGKYGYGTYSYGRYGNYYGYYGGAYGRRSKYDPPESSGPSQR